MENVPVRDQGSLGICFAETAAEELSAVQRKLHIPNPVEPSAMAIAAGVSAKTRKNSFTHGGDPCEALAFAKNNGVCSSSDIENTNPDSGGNLAKDLNVVAAGNTKDEFERLFPKPNRCETRNSLVNVSNDKSVLESVLKKSCDTEGDYKLLTKNCSKEPANLQMSKKIRELPLQCHRFPDSKRTQKVKPAEYAQKLNYLLDGPNPLPPMIGFCSSILTDLSKPDAPPAPKDSCGGHAALVIGRREVNGKCQFLLRNSWGPECDHYPPKLQSNCEPGKGNIWIDTDTLTKNTLEVIPPPL
jgi:hypothetical protein